MPPCRLLDDRDSIPVARDPEPDVPVPRILLIGQAPGLQATRHDRTVRRRRGGKAPRLAGAGRHSPRRLLPPGPLRRHHPLLPRPPARRQGRPGTLAPGTSPLPALARRADRDPPAADHPAGGPAGDSHIPGTSRIVDGRCGNLGRPRRNLLHPLAPPLRRQPLAQRAHQCHGLSQAQWKPSGPRVETHRLPAHS